MIKIKYEDEEDTSAKEGKADGQTASTAHEKEAVSQMAPVTGSAADEKKEETDAVDGLKALFEQERPKESSNLERITDTKTTMINFLR